MTDKIVVLAAGKGTRMLSAAGDNPKHLIGINDRPFLYYACHNFLDAGFKKIIIVGGHKIEKMHNFRDEHKDIFPITVVDQFREVGTDRYGTACPVEAVEKVVDDESFVVVNGDDFFSVGDLREMRELPDTHNYITGFCHSNPERFGILISKDGEVLDRIHEKPEPDVHFDSTRPHDYLISPGMYRFTPEIFDRVKSIEKSPRGEYEITDAISLLSSEGRFKIKPIRDYWHTLSRPEDIGEMEEFFRSVGL